jgi:putative DNA primase/helicase
MSAVDLKVLEEKVGKPDLGIKAEPPTPNWLAILNKATVKASELQSMIIPPREFLLRPFFKVGDFGILFAQRGVGKTWLGYGIGRGVSQGTGVGLWTCDEARPVLLVDGEMPLDLSQDRDKQFFKCDGNLYFLHHQVLFDRAGAELNLTHSLIQDALENICLNRLIKLLILDNQSVLFPGVSEKDPDSWNLIQPFLLRLQRRGIAVLHIVHAGRNNQARGHSRREDRASWMISLTDRKDDETEGAKFVSEFTKPSRVCPQSDTPPLLWEFTRGADGKTLCHCQILTKLDQFRQCLEEGMGEDPGAIADAMQISTGYVSKLAAKGIAGRWCKKHGRGYTLVS